MNRIHVLLFRIKLVCLKARWNTKTKVTNLFWEEEVVRKNKYSSKYRYMNILPKHSNKYLYSVTSQLCSLITETNKVTYFYDVFDTITGYIKGWTETFLCMSWFDNILTLLWWKPAGWRFTASAVLWSNDFTLSLLWCETGYVSMMVHWLLSNPQPADTDESPALLHQQQWKWRRGGGRGAEERRC